MLLILRASLISSVFASSRTVKAQPTPDPSNIISGTIDDEKLACPTLYELLIQGANDGKYTSVVKAMNGTKPNLLEEMKNKNNLYTLFVPDDMAIARDLSPELREKLVEPEWSNHLKGWVTYHMFAGKELNLDEWMEPTEFQDLTQGRTDLPSRPYILYPSLEGTVLALTRADNEVDYEVEEKRVLRGDICAKNGILHEIDGVFSHYYFQSTIDATGFANSDYSMLYSLAYELGLSEVATGPGPNTILAPDNAALSQLKLDPNQRKDAKILKKILMYHIFPGSNVVSETLNAGDLIETMLGEPLLVTESGFRNSRVKQGNILVANGVIHTVDKVMIPPSFGESHCFLKCEAWCDGMKKKKVHVCHNGKTQCIAVKAWENRNCKGSDTCGECDKDYGNEVF